MSNSKFKVLSASRDRAVRITFATPAVPTSPGSSEGEQNMLVITADSNNDETWEYYQTIHKNGAFETFKPAFIKTPELVAWLNTQI